MTKMVYTLLSQLVYNIWLEFVTGSQHCPTAGRQNRQMEEKSDISKGNTVGFV